MRKPGRATLRYGGNTSCVEIRCGEEVLLVDCGTGAREAGLALAREFKGKALHTHVFVSHTHWDHIQGFPFFVPAYPPGNCLTIYSVRGADKSLRKPSLRRRTLLVPPAPRLLTIQVESRLDGRRARDFATSAHRWGRQAGRGGFAACPKVPASGSCAGHEGRGIDRAGRSFLHR